MGTLTRGIRVKAGNALGTAQVARLKGWLVTSEGKRFSALLVAAVIVRVVLSFVLRVSPDLQAYETWGELILGHFLHPYTYGIKSSSVWLFPTYPPLTMYLYALVDFLYFGLAHLLGLHPSHCACSPVFRPILLIPGMLSDLAQVSIMYALARAKLSPNLALLVAATYAFSPAVLIDGVGWGQTDNLALLIVAGALLLALRHNGLWAGVLLGLTIALKPQPWIFIPLVLVYLYRWAGWKQAMRGAASMAGTALVLWAPYLVPPRPEIFVWQRSVAINVQASGLVATRNALNLWWLLRAQRLNINAPYLGPLSAQLLGGGLFVLVMLFALAGIWRDASPGRLWASAALLAIGFFDVVTLQYERYIFPAMGLFLLAALYDRRYWVLYAAVSVSAFMSLGLTISTLGYGLAAQVQLVHVAGAYLGWHRVTTSEAALNLVILLVAAGMALFPPPPHGKLERQAKLGDQQSSASRPQLAS